MIPPLRAGWQCSNSRPAIHHCSQPQADPPTQKQGYSQSDLQALRMQRALSLQGRQMYTNPNRIAERVTDRFIRKFLSSGKLSCLVDFETPRKNASESNLKEIKDGLRKEMCHDINLYIDAMQKMFNASILSQKPNQPISRLQDIITLSDAFLKMVIQMNINGDLRGKLLNPSRQRQLREEQQARARRAAAQSVVPCARTPVMNAIRGKESIQVPRPSTGDTLTVGMSSNPMLSVQHQFIRNGSEEPAPPLSPQPPMDVDVDVKPNIRSQTPKTSNASKGNGESAMIDLTSPESEGTKSNSSNPTAPEKCGESNSTNTTLLNLPSLNSPDHERTSNAVNGSDEHSQLTSNAEDLHSNPTKSSNPNDPLNSSNPPNPRNPINAQNQSNNHNSSVNPGTATTSIAATIPQKELQSNSSNPSNPVTQPNMAEQPPMSNDNGLSVNDLYQNQSPITPPKSAISYTNSPSKFSASSEYNPSPVTAGSASRYGSKDWIGQREMIIPQKNDESPRAQTFSALKIIFYPLIREKLIMIINKLKEKDTTLEFFRKVEIPEYVQIIKKPIHFGQIIDRLRSGQYQTIADLKSDINLLWRNCWKYNGEPDPGDLDKVFANFAKKIKETLIAYMSQLERTLKETGYIVDPDLNEIGRIINKFGIAPALTTRLYKHDSKLKLYRTIENLIDTHDAKSFRKFVFAAPSDFCRDLKNGMRAKGDIVPKSKMAESIVKKFIQIKKFVVNQPKPPIPIRPETIPALNTVNTMSTTMNDVETNDINVTTHSTKSASPTLVMSNLTIVDQTDDISSDPPFNADGDRIANPNEESGSRESPESSSDSLGLNVVHKRARRHSNKRAIEDSDSDEDMVDVNNDSNSNSNPNAPIRKKRITSNCSISSNQYSNSANPTTNSHSNSNTNTNMNTNSHQGLIGHHHQQDKSRTLGRVQYMTNKNGVKVRSGLTCPYPRCSSELQLLTAIHDNCFGAKSLMRCMHCKTIIHSPFTQNENESNKSADSMYYHCINGCVNRGKVLSHQYYLCIRCADIQCNSPQLELAFHGVFTLFMDKGRKCQILTISQESNRVSFKSQTGNTFLDRQRDLFYGTISNGNNKGNRTGNGNEEVILKLTLDEDGSAAMMGQKEGILKEMKLDDYRLMMLIFQGQNGQKKKYHKALPKCPKCNVDLMFMKANTVPNHRNFIGCNGSKSQIKCHGNNDYDPMKYAAIKSMNYVSTHGEDIGKSWYYHCNKCHDYSLCAGCTLVGHETAIKDHYRRRRGMNRNSASVRSSSVSMSAMRYGDDRRKRTYAEMNAGNEDAEVVMLRKQVQQLKRERDQWKAHYEKLANLLNTAEEYHKEVIKRS